MGTFPLVLLRTGVTQHCAYRCREVGGSGRFCLAKRVPFLMKLSSLELGVQALGRE